MSLESQEIIKEKLLDSIVNVDRNLFSGLDLYNNEVKSIPKLLDPFLQKVGLAALVGTSDAGKSTFLRQLSLAIALEQENFLDFNISATTNKVLYVSTEDDVTSVSYAIKKQIDKMIHTKDTEVDIGLLKNIDFIFEPDDLLRKLKKILKKDPKDLIVIDAFTDVFTKEINANTQVRNFLNGFDKLAKKHNCLIIFLHHIGKKATNYSPSKDSIIGSQGFEAKMRVVLELRPRTKSSNEIDLWVLKGNFLEKKHKTKSFLLHFGKDLSFTNTGEQESIQKIQQSKNSKIDNSEITKKVLALSKKGYSYRKIEEELKFTKYKVSKSVIGNIIKKNKKPSS